MSPDNEVVGLNLQEEIDKKKLEKGLGDYFTFLSDRQSELVAQLAFYSSIKDEIPRLEYLKQIVSPDKEKDSEGNPICKPEYFRIERLPGSILVMKQLYSVTVEYLREYEIDVNLLVEAGSVIPAFGHPLDLLKEFSGKGVCFLSKKGEQHHTMEDRVLYSVVINADSSENHYEAIEELLRRQQKLE